MKMIPVFILEQFIADLMRGDYHPQIDNLRMLERLIKRYEPDRPCHYRLECLEMGRCPKEISCDN